ncbi:MAG: hypothetical protein ACI4OJ_06685 [Lachnospiraceae bacterium]
MCGTILAAVILLAVGIMIAWWLLVIFAVVFFLLACDAAYRRRQCIKLQPTPMVCKNCGSTNVKIRSRVSGYQHTGGSTFAGGINFWQGATSVLRQRVYECQDCGFSDDYVTQDDINRTANLYSQRTGLYLLLSFVFAALAILICHSAG